MAILREVWKFTTQLKDPKEFIRVAEVYIELPAKNFTVRRARGQHGAVPLG